jgi:hypothetical protein
VAGVADRVFGGGGVGLEVGVARKLEDALALSAELGQVPGFVLVALAPDQVGLRVVDLRPADIAASDADLEVRQVRAGEVVRQVSRREAKRPVPGKLHAIEYRPVGGGALCPKATLSPAAHDRP